MPHWASKLAPSTIHFATRKPRSACVHALNPPRNIVLVDGLRELLDPVTAYGWTTQMSPGLGTMPSC
eukprot:1548591-Lingulodinium_polyedra.AAC.1